MINWYIILNSFFFSFQDTVESRDETSSTKDLFEDSQSSEDDFDEDDFDDSNEWLTCSRKHKILHLSDKTSLIMLANLEVYRLGVLVNKVLHHLTIVYISYKFSLSYKSTSCMNINSIKTLLQFMISLTEIWLYPPLKLSHCIILCLVLHCWN